MANISAHAGCTSCTKRKQDSLFRKSFLLLKKLCLQAQIISNAERTAAGPEGAAIGSGKPPQWSSIGVLALGPLGLYVGVLQAGVERNFAPAVQFTGKNKSLITPTEKLKE